MMEGLTDQKDVCCYFVRARLKSQVFFSEPVQASESGIEM